MQFEFIYILYNDTFYNHGGLVLGENQKGKNNLIINLGNLF